MLNALIVNFSFCTSDQEAGNKSTPLLSIILPVVVAITAIIIITVALMIIIWRRRNQGEDKSHNSPDHVYDVPDGTTMMAINVNPTQCAEVSPNEPTTNIVSTASGQLVSTGVSSSEVQHSDMKSNIAYGSIASSQQVCTDMKSNIAYGCITSDKCHASEELSSQVSTL